MSAQALPFEERRDEALGRSLVLAGAVHLILIAVMFVGVRYQSHPPETVTVELWEAPPPPPPPKVVVEPPKPPPKIEPEPAPEIKKPDIVVREKPKPKPKPKVEAKPQADPDFERRLREQVAMEQETLDKERRSREARERAVRQAADARAKALAAWMDKIRAKIRGNIPTSVLEQVAGNPEAIFDVTLLPTGEVLTRRMRQSSGNALYDQAIERAILKSSPLPKPDDPKLFDRQLELRFRPLDQ